MVKRCSTHWIAYLKKSMSSLLSSPVVLSHPVSPPRFLPAGQMVTTSSDATKGATIVLHAQNGSCPRPCSETTTPCSVSPNVLLGGVITWMRRHSFCVKSACRM